ncbi:OmpA family protein [Pseudomonas nitroreducens]|uniref:OmpA family protein n=1 Tax=Pseudomonas nitroreducens TaxID=46680 RepID=UPI00209D7CD8|nr:OmpA family protein [Pseudomonas nitroreducens]MCP1626229.1 type VI secretion system protein VasL [Pseudomonas nitroreducens]
MSVVEEKLNLGGDPQGSEQSSALTAELEKISHPARPDIDWARVERLCLAQFREHGMELQSAAAFALARAQQRGLSGLREGLDLIERLFQRNWQQLWPPALPVRLEILAWLFAELRPWLRGQHWSDDDLPELLCLDAQLKRLAELLARHEPAPVLPLQALCGQLQGLLKRLAPETVTADVEVASTTATAETMTTAAAPAAQRRVSPARNRTLRNARSQAPAVVVLKLDGGEPPVEQQAASKRRPLRAWLLLLGILLVLTGLLAWAHSRWWPAMTGASEPLPAVVAGSVSAAQAPAGPVRLDSQLLFPPGESTLKPESTRMLVSSLLGIKAQPGWRIVISGHSDSTGDPRRNLELSRNRAEAVRDWMQRMGDIPEDCFVVRGAGSSEPIASDDSEEGRNVNRRVEITLMPGDGTCEKP